ncbi:MAG: NADH:ubiquinone reductase (Na(+)-transporting) subunit F [Calditrichaeota bacterium]|nr:NADH:ubiquinone reductase (Na(+)-transporting) subunit F [Calditrichota bacterium]
MFETIGLSIFVFTVLILLLVMILMYASSKLVNSGEVKIIVNGDKEHPIVTPAGSTLLSTLGNQKVLLPSACGGGGTCALCLCQVKSGGGDVLPTEEGHLTRGQQKDGWRLACQVKVKQDMEIRVPDEIFSIKKWECEVVSNKSVATFIKEFVVKLPKGERLEFEAGGYIQIDIPKYNIDFRKDIAIDAYDPAKQSVFEKDWESMGLFNLKAKNSEEVFRAYSMANHPAEGDIVMLNVRIATPPWDRSTNKFMDVPPGIASSYIYSRKPGDKVMVSGPYGEFFVQETEREMCFIGGGAGMAPMRSHIFNQFHTHATKRKTTFWYGARSQKERFYDKDFQDIENKFDNFKYHVALSEPLPEDNWKGPTGFIHQVVHDEYLSKHPAPEDIEYYLCGPPMMLDAIKKMLYNLGVDSDMIRYDEF